MSTICVDGNEFKIYQENCDGTITLTDQFKSLLNILYYFPPFITNGPANNLLDTFDLPKTSEVTISGRSDPSTF